MNISNNGAVFERYAGYYDLIYQDKYYAQEARYIIAMLQSLNPQAQHLIELGSGTGNYSGYFADAGYHVTGIEKSESMIAGAKLKSIKNFNPLSGNMVSFDLGKEHDAAVSLFDTMGYLTKTGELISCFQSIAANLKKNGILIFDSWYTPAVYHLLPAVRIKRVEDSQYHITRLAEPVIYYHNNTVDVNYEFIIKNKADNQYRTLKEVHTLRHFSIPDIENIAGLTGFELIKCEELLTAKPADLNTWKVCFLLKKR